jgi:CRP-like cAMP-binding protein
MVLGFLLGESSTSREQRQRKGDRNGFHGARLLLVQKLDNAACQRDRKRHMIEIMLKYIQALPHTLQVFRKGQHLFHQGDTIVSMFLIDSGEARLLRRQRDGSAIVLQRALPGSFLAEASLFTASYHCDAIATTQVSTRLISRPAMRKLFESDPTFAAAWASHLADEVRSARQRAEILALKTVAERLNAWTAAKSEFPPKGTWKAVAQEIGTSPEALYREITQRKER